MLASVNHILGLANIRRARVLPVGGKVLVRVGQKVSASDVIAEAQVATRHLMLDIRRSIGGATAADTDRSIVCHPGDKVQPGDVVAESGGLFSRIVRAPVSGTVVMASGGRVLLEVETQPLQLFAGVPGTVIELIPERGARIEVNGALIQGAWGNGRVSEGTLVPLLHSPEEELTSEMLEVSLRGAVVAAGHCSQVKVLRAAADLPLRGLVLGSISSDLMVAAASMTYPILVTEGFGRIPMNQSAYQLITTSEKRDVSLNTVLNLAMGERPEMIIPLPAAGPDLLTPTYFAPNQVVRIQGDPYRGKMGVIVQIRPGLTILPNGLRTSAADIRLDATDMVAIVPLANLEVIE